MFPPRLTKVTNWLGEQAPYVYDGDGRLATSTQFNGITTAYTYDAASRLTTMGSEAANYQLVSSISLRLFLRKVFAGHGKACPLPAPYYERTA